MEYKVIKDKRRKKMVMTVENDRTVLIKAPKWARKSDIQHFYEVNKDWIRSQKQKLAAEK
ncbi:MAG: DUF45 domain-containing protein, partial [Oscillospiraceae bacterium]|nr:DUF45 domain-containing protein [Oscillospiraceae bacterium]